MPIKGLYLKLIVGVYTIQFFNITKRAFQILIIGMLLTALIPIAPASAEVSTLDIDIVENMNVGYTYAPELPTGGSTTVTTAVSGTGEITIKNTLTSTTLYDVTIVFNTGSTSNWQQTGGDTAVITDNGATQSVHIAKLEPGAAHNVVITYDVESTATPPVQLTVTYDSNKVTVGGNTAAHLTLARSDAIIGTADITGVIATIDPANLDADAQDDFALSSTSGETALASGNLVWTLSSALTTASPTRTLDFTITESDSNAHNDASAYVQIFNAATTTLQYTIAGTKSVADVSVSGNPTAKTDKFKIDLKKVLNSGTSYDFTPKVENTNTEDITYSLTSVSFWVTPNNQLNTVSSSQTITTGMPLDIVDGSSWTGSPITVNIGSVPAGFIKPFLSIKNTDTQMPKSYSSGNGAAYTMLKKIWVVNGYNIQVEKSVAETGTPGVYDITIVVRNTGTKASPPNVIVYDIVPTTFYNAGTSPTNFLPAPVSAAGTPVSLNVDGVPGADITGQAYYWNLGSIAAAATTSITYRVTGAADYPLSDVMLVGIDPAQSFNPLMTSPILKNTATMVNSNLESVMMIGVLGVFVIGLVGTVRRRM